MGTENRRLNLKPINPSSLGRNEQTIPEPRVSGYDLDWLLPLVPPEELNSSSHGLETYARGRQTTNVDK